MAESLRRFLPRLRKRPGMYVPSLSYITVCAFLDGYALASDEEFGDFRQWLVGRGTSRPELGWPWLVLAHIYPAGALPDPRGFNEEQDREAVDMMFDLLAEFYET
ncbi:MAG: hypothetical protein ACK5MT_15515 [Actinomycetales bacterium]